MNGDAKPQKRMGRPPKTPEKGKRQNYTFRMSDADRDKVLAAADASGRSMSEEIERRVENSFLVEGLVDAVSAKLYEQSEKLMGGAHNVDLFVYLSHTIWLTEHAEGKRWTDDAATRDLVRTRIIEALPYALSGAVASDGGLSGHVERREAFRIHSQKIIEMDEAEKAKENTEKD